MEFFSQLFSGAGFIPRAICGQWTPGLIRLHNISDFLIWTAYLAIPLVLIRFAYSRRRELPFRQLFLLFGIFILACGTTHLLDIVLFYNPVYRLSGLVKLITAAASWGTVIALFHVVPHALKMRSPQDLEREIEQRQSAEAQLQTAHDQLEEHVLARTAELRASEDQFRVLIEAMPQIVWTARTDGFLDYYNQQWVDYTGMSVEQTTSQGWEPVVHPDDLQLCIDAWNHSVQSGENYEIEYRFKRASDGEYRWFLGRALPLRDESGNIVKWFGTGTDIDDQKRSREELGRLVGERTAALTQTNAALERANETLQAEIAHRQRVESEAEHVFELSPDKLCVADFNGFFKRLNPAWETSLGYTREELMARPFVDFVHPDDVGKTVDETGRNMAGENTMTFENRYRCKDGSYKWLAWRAKVVPEEGLVYGAARDITERILAEQTLKDTLVQLERSNGDLQHFASIASHDLQEPLRAIQAFGDRLQTRHSAGMSDEARDYLSRMQSAADRMRALIQDLLAYSRVATQVRPFTPVDLATSIGSVMSDLSVRIEETGGRVIVDELPTIEADPMQMRQLFQNLIANALKFHRENEAPVVRVSALSSTNETVEIAVEDNGIGFDTKFADRIFAPFERLHSQRKYSGTGIGLAICRKIAERHGGSIRVESAPGEGSRFLITLPKHHVENAPSGAPQESL